MNMIHLNSALQNNKKKFWRTKNICALLFWKVKIAKQI